MRTFIETMIIRDRGGYKVHDYGNPALDPKATLAGQPPSGVYIVGISGINEIVTISTTQNLRLWEKARELDSPDELVVFMNRWGQLSRWLGDDGSRPYSEPYILIRPHLDGIKQLAKFVDAGDRDGFGWSLNGRRLLDRANLKIEFTQSSPSLVLEAPSLLRFMLIEMWNEFGGDRPTRLGFKSCEYCGNAFQIGGRRGMRSRRVDAQFCSDSCRNMASRARARSQKKDSPTPQQ